MLVVIALAASAAAAPVGGGGEEVQQPRIDTVAPNPVSEGNIGEFVVIDPGPVTDLGQWRLTDGNREAVLPSAHVEGPVAVSRNPRVTELLTDRPVLGWDGALQLAADGDVIQLVDPDGRVVDEVNYPRTSRDDHWRRDGEGLTASPAEYRPLRFDARHDGRATVFVLPDAPDVPLTALANATDRLWLAGYELTDPAVRDVVRERHAAGVDVRVLVDGSPVGGQSADEVATLNRLDEEGIPVHVLVGARDRFRFHHPKYAVIDDSAIVMTENWKRAGTGGASSRGWGVRVEDGDVASDLATVFETDVQSRDAVSWTWKRAYATGRDAEPADGQYDRTFDPAPVEYDRVSVVVAPTMAEDTLRELIRDAETRIDVQQVQIGDAGFPLLVELIRAAERGVDVRLLLDSQWYVRDRNEPLAAELNALAEAEGLPLEVRLVEPDGRFGKIHTKGMLIDDDVTVVGSMNWNNVSMRENREVVLVIQSTDATAYFRETFEHDWETLGTPVPAGLVAATVATWVGAGLLARRFVTFDGSA